MNVHALNSAHRQSYAFSANPLPKQKLDNLPKEIIGKIFDYIFPDNAYLNYRNPNRLGICYTSKALSFKTIEYSILKTKQQAVNEIVRKTKGNIENLQQVAKNELKELGKSTKSLDLSGIKLTAGTLQMLSTYFPNLESLDLSCCQLDDNSFEYVMHFTKLKTLSLNDNREITSTAIGTLGEHIPQLTALNLASSSVDDDALNALITSLPRLQKLILFDCNNLTHECTTAIARLTELQELNISHCRWITDNGFKFLTILKDIKILIIINCRNTSDEIVKMFIEFPQLRELECDQLTTTTFDSLLALQQLTKLHLHKSPFALNDELIIRLLQLQQLEELALPALLNFSVIHFNHFTQFPNLTSLDLSGIVLFDVDIKILATISNLKKLNLSNCDITDSSLQHLVSLQNLEVLNLSRSKITNDGLKQLSQLSNLRELDLSHSSKITTQGLISIAKLPRLSTLNLSYCEDLIQEGYIQLHHLGVLANLTKLMLNNWDFADHTDYIKYSFSELLNTTLNNFDNAINDPPLLCAIHALQKQLPGLEITLQELPQLKSTLQKIWDTLCASYTLLLDGVMAFATSPNSISHIIDAHKESTSDSIILNFLSWCEMLYTGATFFLILRCLALAPSIAVVGMIFFAMWICAESGQLTNSFEISTMLGIGMVGTYVSAFIPISLSITLSIAVMATLGVVTLSPSITEALSYAVDDVASGVFGLI